MASPHAGVFGARITQAREARGMTMSTLADLVQVSTTTISNYEAERHGVPIDKALDIARYLRQPLEFFQTKPLEDDGESGTSRFRSLRASQQKKAQVERRLLWLSEILTVLDRHVVLPPLRVPDPPYRTPGECLPIDTIEQVAAEVRALWDLGTGPLEDLTYAAEANGVIIQRLALESEIVDAYSRWSGYLNRPIILLNASKNNMVRSRFDLAHELGHLILQRNLDEAFAVTAGWKAIEREAHRFASALLLPRSSWLPEAASASTLNDYLRLKPRWMVSAKAMIYRARELGHLSSDDYTRLMKDYSRRRWNKGEPFDSEWQAEVPTLLREAAMLVSERKTQLRRELLRLDETDLEQLLGTDALSSSSVVPITLRSGGSPRGGDGDSHPYN